MSELRVFHNHELIGVHDRRCEERLTPEQTHYRYHDGNDLVVVEGDVETRYPAGTWSGAGVDLHCAYMQDVGTTGCPRCEPPPAPRE